MRVEPYGGNTPPPTFNSPSTGSVGPSDHEVREINKNRHERTYYKDSSDLDSSKLQKTTPSLVDNINSLLDSVYNYFWGTPLDESPGSPISGTPKLRTPEEQKSIQVTLEKLLLAFEKMNERAEKVTEVNEAEAIETLSDDEVKILYMILTLLNQRADLKKESNVISMQSIQVIQQAINDAAEEGKKAISSFDEADKNAAIAGKFALGSTVAGGLIAAVQALGPYVPALAPASGAAGILLSAGVAIASGISTTVETKFDQKKIKEKATLDSISHYHKKSSNEIQTYRERIRRDREEVTNVLTTGADIIQDLHKTKKGLTYYQ